MRFLLLSLGGITKLDRHRYTDVWKSKYFKKFVISETGNLFTVYLTTPSVDLDC
jgi:hypothetical protein